MSTDPTPAALYAKHVRVIRQVFGLTGVDTRNGFRDIAVIPGVCTIGLNLDGWWAYRPDGGDTWYTMPDGLAAAALDSLIADELWKKRKVDVTASRDSGGGHLASDVHWTAIRGDDDEGWLSLTAQGWDRNVPMMEYATASACICAVCESLAKEMADKPSAVSATPRCSCGAELMPDDAHPGRWMPCAACIDAAGAAAVKSMDAFTTKTDPAWTREALIGALAADGIPAVSRNAVEIGRRVAERMGITEDAKETSHD
jgi:hypothetical protein